MHSPKEVTSPISSDSPVQRASSKPIRLRSACNQCCSAKVKCSGERSGCERCRNLRAQCTYSESRVGKVPGIRAKKRQERSEQRSRTETAAHRNSCATTASSSNSESHQDDTNETSTQWRPDSGIDLPEHASNDFHDGDLELLTRAATDDVVHQNPGSSEHVITSMDAELIMPTMDFNFENFMRPFPAPAPEPIALRASTPIWRGKSHNESDSQIVIDCTQIINDLENYIVADLKSFKIVLSLVKRALEKVVQLSNMQQDSQNARCMVLLVVIVHQIIELLELCHIILMDDSTKQRDANSGLPPVSTALLPGLGSGDFGIDVEEQNAWRSQMVTREVRQAMEVVRKLKKLASLGSERLSDNSFQGRSRSLWYEELELRLTDLMGRIVRR